eukprot:COSAG02_NODE_116_length_35392_cov_302.150001_12_plen_714_part_00
MYRLRAGTAHAASTCQKVGCVAADAVWDASAETCTVPEAPAPTPITSAYTQTAPEEPGGDLSAADGDATWLLLCGILVFLMQSGFALLEVGSVSVRNTQNILFKNMVDPTVAAILFWAVGYPLAYGSGNGFIGGFDESTFTHGVDNAATDSILTCSSPACDGIDLEVFVVVDSCSGFNTCEGFCVMDHGTDDDCKFEETATDGYDGAFWAGWFFQWAFCATTATIVSGAVAERMKFGVYIVITIFLTGFIYPVVVHWGWADGFASAWVGNVHTDSLLGVGVIDFAGSGVVHMTGGVAALVACIFVGPRHGRFVKHYQKDGHTYAKCQDQPMIIEADGWMEIIEDETSPSGEKWQSVDPEIEKELSDSLPFEWKTNPFPASSSTFQTFGTLILWFGWYGFNCGSTLGISGGYAMAAAKVAVLTTIGAAGGGLSSATITYLFDSKTFDLGAIGNGVLAGLVSITSPCAVVEPWAGLLIGMLGGVFYYASSKFLLKLRIDDVVGASPVHMFCGIWGVIACGLFTSQKNWAYTYACTIEAVPDSCLPENDNACGEAMDPTLTCTFLPGDESSCGPSDGYEGTGKCVYTEASDPAPDDPVSCGIFYGCELAGTQLLAQIIFVLCILGWTAGTVGAVCGVLKLVVKDLAYDAATQAGGMDIKHHGGIQGPEFATAYTAGLTSTVTVFGGTPSSPGKTAIPQAIPQSTLQVASPRLKPRP